MLISIGIPASIAPVMIVQSMHAHNYGPLSFFQTIHNSWIAVCALRSPSSQSDGEISLVASPFSTTGYLYRATYFGTFCIIWIFTMVLPISYHKLSYYKSKQELSENYSDCYGIID